MKEFSTTIPIRAPATRIWTLLTQAEHWLDWNPTITKIEGQIALGQTIKVFVKLSPGRAFPVKVVTFEPNQRMVWASGMPFGLFRGERVFTLNARGSTTEFAMRETFTGLLAPLIGRSIPDLQPAFDEFGRALKTRAERTA